MENEFNLSNPAAEVTAEQLIAGAPPPPAPNRPPEETAAAPGGPVSAPPIPGVTADSGGTPFDPLRHLAKKNPTSGRWMPRGGRKPAAGSFIPADEGPPGASSAPAGAGGPVAPAGPDVYRAMADMHVRAFYGVTVGLLSDEWLPQSGEHETNVDVLAAYYRAKGMTPDSPGYALILVGITYAGKRLAMPKTQTRLAGFRAWVGRLIASWRGRQAADKLAAAK